MGFTQFLSVCLLVLMVFASSAFADAPSERRNTQITQKLLSEGFDLSHSTVAGILKSIETGQHDAWFDVPIAYSNLERFKPYSEQVSSDIVNLIERAVLHSNHNVNIQRLLVGFYATPTMSNRSLDRLSVVMHEMAASEEKRSLAVFLTRSPLHKQEALAVLEQLLSPQIDSKALQISAAFHLLHLGVSQQKAEAVLRKGLQSVPGAKIVIRSTAEFYASDISDALFKDIQNSIILFTMDEKPQVESWLAEIAKDRTSQTKTPAKECQAELGSNVVRLSDFRRK